MRSLDHFLGGFADGLRDFGRAVSTAADFLLLSFVYFAGVGMTSAAARIMKKRFLGIRGDECRKSYFSEEEIGREDEESYYRQF